MPALRTSLVALAVGGAAVATGVVAGSATAAPSPVAAVSAVNTDGGATADADDDDGRPFRAGVRRWVGSLTDDQRQCLEAAGLQRPAWPLDDDERARVRAQVESVAADCGVELPFASARAFWEGLTDTQQQCLKDAGPMRPLGPLTRAERGQLWEDRRSAAEQCGVTLPTRESATSS